MNCGPNVLLIHADEHRFDCLGAYGNEQVRTPHLDGLAADGVLYRNSFCTFPICTPSRYSLLTGLYVHQHLGWTNRCTIPAGLDTFPRLLRQAGYATAAVGKMHLTPTYADVGFARMRLAEQHGQGRHDDDYHRYLRAEGLCDGVDLMDQELQFRRQAPPSYWQSFGAMQSDLDEEHHSTTWIAREALEELEGWQADRPNLLMVGFIKPHHPFDPPAPWSGMYDPRAIRPLPGWLDQPLQRDVQWDRGYFPHTDLSLPSLRRVMAMYYASISQVDFHVGRMLELLKRRGLYDNTLIIYTSDHGDYMGYHHLLLKCGYCYDPLVKVPLIIKFPSDPVARSSGDLPAHSSPASPPGAVNQALVSGVDLAPTILACCGLAKGKFMPGLDLAACPQGHDAVFVESGRQREYMVRTARHKLILTVNGDKPDAELPGGDWAAAPGRTQVKDAAAEQRQGQPIRGENLFLDLTADPLEMQNLYHQPQAQAEIAKLKDRLLAWLAWDAPTPVHLQEQARTICGPNVPSDSDGHARQSEEYFGEKMRQAL